MKFIKLPQLATPISVIGFGTANSAFSPGNYAKAADLLECYLELGGNLVDTAHIYGFGDSEKTLGKWLKDSGRRKELVLVTKGCHPVVDPNDIFAKPWVPRVTAAAIRADLTESLERLQTEFIDLYLLHRDDESVPVGPLVEALNGEQANGRIHAFGVSNWRVERIVEANQYASTRGLNGMVVSSPNLSLAIPNKMQFPGTLFADEEARQWHRQQQFPLLAWSSLGAGFMSGRFSQDDPFDETMTQVYYSEGNFERLRRAGELAVRKGVSLAQIGLTYVLHQPFPTIALIGTTSNQNLIETIGALDVVLSHDEMDFLDLKHAEK